MCPEFIEKKQLVYELMNGTWDLEALPVEESEFVKDELEQGQPCEQLYQQAYEAAKRICKRLEIEEDDEDILLIFNNLMKITKYFSLKMYDYGVMFSDMEQQERKRSVE